MRQKMVFKNNRYYCALNTICLALLIAASIYIFLHLGSLSGLIIILFFMWGIWILVTAFELFFPFTYLNALKRLTEENKKRYVRYIANMLCSIKLVWILLFSLIPYYIVNSVRLPGWPIPVVFVLTLAAMVFWGTKASLLLDMRYK